MAETAHEVGGAALTGAASIDELLENAKAPLEEARVALEEQEQRLSVELDSVREQLKRLNKTIAGLMPVEKTSRPSKSGNGMGTVRVSRHTLEIVYAALQERGEGTIAELAEAVGLSQPAISTAIRDLRSEERVRLAGRKGNAQLFKLWENTGKDE